MKVKLRSKHHIKFNSICLTDIFFIISLITPTTLPRYAWITALLCFSTLFFRLCKLCKARDYPSETLGKVWGNRLEKNITSEKLSGLFSKTKFDANICKRLLINRVNKTWNWPKFKLKAFFPRFNSPSGQMFFLLNSCGKQTFVPNHHECWMHSKCLFF